MPAQKKVFGVGIIGFGFMGRTHAYGHVNLPLFYDPAPCRTRLIGIADVRPEVASAAREALGLELGTPDWRELIAHPKIQIIHVCTPNKFHKEQALAALGAGKHVYCDKPLCMNPEEAREIEAALPRAKSVHQMALQYRFLPATRRAKQLVEEGFLGEVLSLRAAYLHSGSADPSAPLKWKLDPAMGGGGVLFDLGSHVLDLVQFLVGPLRIAAASTYIAYPERPRPEAPAETAPVTAEDAIFLTVRTNNGAPGHLEASKIATGAADEVRLELHGSRGALRFNSMQPNYLEVYDQTQPASARGWKALDTIQAYGPPAVLPPPKMTIGWLRPHAASLYNFLSAVAEGRPAEPSLRVGVQLQYLMAEAYEKAQRG